MRATKTNPLREDARPRREAAELAAGFMTSRMLYVAAHLGIAEHLGDGTAGLDDLARATATHPPSLERFLRGLAEVGILAEEPPGRFRLTPRGSCLRRSHPESILRLVLECGAPHVQAAWTELTHALRTGRSAFSFALGADYWAYVGRHPDLADSAFESLSSAEREAVAALDFSGIATLVDVGGGRGELVAAILGRNPRLKGIVFDLPAACPVAAGFLAGAGLGERASFAGGDFFTAVPPGADVYLLAGVLRDWNDADAQRILAACRKAAGTSGRVLVVEPTPASTPAAADLHRMVLFGPGRERSTDELRALVVAAGFAPGRVRALAAGMRLVEAHPGASPK